MRKRNRQILIRLSDEELEKFKIKIQKSKLNQSAYLRNCILEKPINVFENNRDYLIELKRIGNNLNQLTRAVHVGKINCGNELEELKGDVKKLWQLLKSLKVEKH